MRPAAPAGWTWAQDPAGSYTRLYRGDGLVVVQGHGPPAQDVQAGVEYVLGFEARAPRLHLLRGSCPRRVEGETPEEACARADAAWPRSRAPLLPVPGMTVWHVRCLYAVASAVRSSIPSHPGLGAREVWRLVLVPVEGINDRAAPRAHTIEVLASEWPATLLIVDPAQPVTFAEDAE